MLMSFRPALLGLFLQVRKAKDSAAAALELCPDLGTKGVSGRTNRVGGFKNLLIWD